MRLPNSFIETWAPRALSILRIATGFMFMAHGMQKILGFPVARAAQTVLLSTSGIAGLMELIGGALILLGLFTRPVAFLLSGEMAFAYFIAHAPQGFWPISMGGNAGESAILYCFIFLYFAFVGAGVWSLDEMRSPASRTAITAGAGRRGRR